MSGSVMPPNSGSGRLALIGRVALGASALAVGILAVVLASPSQQAVGQSCAGQFTINFNGLPAGTIIGEQYAGSGVHISAVANQDFPDALIVFDTNDSNTQTHDPDLAVDIGNIAIFAKNLTDVDPADGLVDDPDENDVGGIATFAFDQEVSIGSVLWVDKDHVVDNFVVAYNAAGEVIVSVPVPLGANGSVQRVEVNADGVRRLEFVYQESGGFTGIEVGCEQGVPTPTAAAGNDAAGGPPTLTMAGGVALNCVANARIAAQTRFDRVWVQPAAGDAGTALGAALHVATTGGDRAAPIPGVALGRGWTDEELEAELRRAALPYSRPASIAAETARVLAAGGIVAWHQGRGEYGPRALGHRSLLAHPGHVDTTARMNDVKGREQFRPIAPMVRAERAAEIFDGVLPSPYMLFVHKVRLPWRDRIPAVVHVDGTARVQTVAADDEPLVAAMLAEFERLTGLPVVVNTSLNTAGRPMVDTPREALELFGSTPVALLAIGPYAVHRNALAAGG